jgi:iron complex outermembrane recepter protein
VQVNGAASISTAFGAPADVRSAPPQVEAVHIGKEPSNTEIAWCLGYLVLGSDQVPNYRGGALTRFFFANPRPKRWRDAELAGVLATAMALLSMTAPAAARSDEALSPELLKRMSLEELMDIEVISVSRRPEKLARAASAIQVITGDDIRRSGATSIPEALRLASNLDVARKNSHDWAISARGFNTELANKLLVMIDGRTVYTPLFSGVFWDRQNYLLQDIDRIEVISGPGGTLWGANAVNGVINIITKSASQSTGTYLEAGAGNQLEAIAGLRHGGSISPDVSFRVYAMYFARDAEVLGSGAGADDSWSKRQGGFRIDAAASPRDSLTLQGDVYDGDEDLVAGSTSGVSGSNVLGRWTRALADDAELSLQVYIDRTHLSQHVPALIINSTVFAPAGVLVDDLDTYDLDFQHRARLGERHQVVWGLGYRSTHDVVRNAPALAFLPPRLTQALYSGFVQDEMRLRDDLFLTLGTKVEHNDYTGFELEPSARLQWNLGENDLLWASVSRAVRIPSRVDRDFSQPGPGSALVILRGSPDFRSETVVASEMGYRTEFAERVSASLSLFYNDYRDLRSATTTPVQVLPFFFENNLEGTTHGAELSVNWQVLDGWRLHAGFSWIEESLRVKPGSIDINNALNETADPSHRALLRSSLDLSGNLQFDTTLRRVADRPIHSGPVLGHVPGYSELDLRLAWRPGDDVELSLVGQNLLHRRHHEYGFPGPEQVEIERAVYGKVSWLFD